MIFVADENVQRSVVEKLRQRGHDVRHIRELMPGATDDTVLRTTAGENAILLTYDRDFGELVFRQGRAATGVILVRCAALPPLPMSSQATQIIGCSLATRPRRLLSRRHRPMFSPVCATSSMDDR
jgi:predicted nuclease of predicted toxin-antitoxin system